MAATVILSAHGAADFNQQTTVPARVSVIFYQPFGQILDNDVGFRTQTELTRQRRTDTHSVALWHGPTTQKPFLTLHSETQGKFISGFIIVGTSHREQLTSNKLWSLNYVCQEARRLCPNEDVEIHYLACLTQ
jgi:hypothetical protein